MSTTHGQPGLSSDQRSTIRSAILSTRHTLEDELRRQLEKYGIYEAKKLPLDKLTHLSAEEIHTRRTLDAAIERELESTEGDLERSITNYVREATKTYLNRFVALKTIEVRGLVEETITERPEYGNRSYMHHTVAEIGGELTNAPDDGYSAALDLAYQEIGAEIRMIFEESEHTAINLDVQVREEVLDELDAIADEAWESDEALGWVYQYFGEDEREEIDERIDDENYKVSGTDIATKTQLFTPRYIVEWMIDNTLGRTWLEMHGEWTNIADEENCFYLAPMESSLIDRAQKPVEDITVLDPACGSGHMLFYAFDVLYQMYLEEAEIPKSQIPNAILKNNLYGIDIDPGVTQLTALSLFLKAKKKEPNVNIDQINVVSADAVLLNGEKKREILTGLSKLEKQIVEAIWESFDNIREYGSLVRIEQKIDDLIKEWEHDNTEFAEGQTRFTVDSGLEGQTSLEHEDDSWSTIKKEILDRVRSLAEEAIYENNAVEEIFTNEVEKSVNLLDIFLGDYDVVVTNPPYLDSGKMGNQLNSFVKNNYIGSRDLYSAFIERCIEFSSENSYAALVTPENFMFQYSYRKLRGELVNNTEILEGAHLSRYGFDQQKDAYTIPFLLRNSKPSEEKYSRFYRMTHEQKEYPDYQSKIRGLEEITTANRKHTNHDDVYVVDQLSFAELNGQPFTYWLGQEVLSLHSEYPTIASRAEVLRGLDTGDDERFVRKYWEIHPSNYNEWKSYMLSPTDLLYHEPVRKKVLWGKDGNEIKSAESSIVPSEEFFFKSGLLFRRWGNNYNVKLLPENCIASKSPGIYLDNSVDEYYLLGYLNSSLVRYFMKGLNPSLNFGITDTEQIPVKFEPTNDDISNLAKIGCDLQMKLQQLNEVNEEYDYNVFLEKFVEDSLMTYSDLLESDIMVIHGLIDGHVFDEYGISNSTVKRIYKDVPVNLADYEHISHAGELVTEGSEFREEIEIKDLENKEYQQIVDEIADRKGDDIREISESLEISPYSVSMIRQEYDLYSSDRKEEVAGRLLSYYIGAAMGRWDLKNLSPVSDGIIPFDDSFDSNVMDVIQECLESSFGPDSSRDQISKIESLLGKSIEDWLRTKFFRYHHTKQYRRRGQRIPIYWQLESPNGAFSCFIYYHDIDTNTLPKLRGQYLDPRINELENELETLNAQTSGESPDKELLNRIEEVQNDLDDIKGFRETIDQMIDDSVTVDVEEGIWENIKEWDRYEVLETGLPKLKSSYSR